MNYANKQFFVSLAAVLVLHLVIASALMRAAQPEAKEEREPVVSQLTPEPEESVTHSPVETVPENNSTGSAPNEEKTIPAVKPIPESALAAVAEPVPDKTPKSAETTKNESPADPLEASSRLRIVKLPPVDSPVETEEPSVPKDLKPVEKTPAPTPVELPAPDSNRVRSIRSLLSE